MRYFGGKARTGASIAAFLETLREGRPYFEPFVGACGVLQHVTGVRYGFDAHKDLVLLLTKVRDEGVAWIPDSVSRTEYLAARFSEPSALRGFIGYACSFCDKWFDGYADCRRGEDFCAEGKRSLGKLRPHLDGVNLETRDYCVSQPSGFLVMCDPPYNRTSDYSAVGKFNSHRFWAKVREWSADNTVVTLEYTAPEDFEVLAELNTTVHVGFSQGIRYVGRRTLKFYRYREVERA